MSVLARMGAYLTARLGLPAGRSVALALAAFICALPGLLFWDELSNPRLKGDDFVFLAESRGGHEPLRGLFAPHNAHVVPLFRLITSALARAAGSLGGVAAWLTWGNYFALGGLMLGVGHVVAWETRKVEAGLAAMAGTGLSTVIFPAVTWYSAGQTLWAALCAVAAVALLQRWRALGGIGWWLGGLFFALMAPWFWTGGLAAGFAGSAYVIAGPRRRACSPWHWQGRLAGRLGRRLRPGRRWNSRSVACVGLRTVAKRLGSLWCLRIWGKTRPRCRFRGWRLSLGWRRFGAGHGAGA
jgi:hypothetical protein